MRPGLSTNKKIFKYCARLVWVILLSGCLSPIDIPTENLGGRIVISGQISTLADQNYVQIGRTSEKERLPHPVSDAVVQLFDEHGNAYEFEPDPFNEGVFLLNGFTGTPGSSYFIRVYMREGGYYESAPERKPESAGELTSSYEIQNEEVTDLEGTVTRQPFLKLNVSTTLPEIGSKFVKLNVEEVYLLTPTDFPDPFSSVPPSCFVAQNADPQRITLIDGDEIKAESIDNLLVASRIIDWSFLERHYFTIYQSSLTAEAYDYWRKVDILANQVGSIFDTPPAEITGNIRNIDDSDEKVYGYFQACNQTFTRRFLLKSDLPFELSVTNCVYDNRDFQRYPQRCLDCLSVRNSSYRRPDWF